MRFFSILVLFFSSQLFSMSDVEILISEGSGHNNYFLYDKAVEILNKAIKLDPHAREAYKERAFSYFELNQLGLALKDYRLAIDPHPPYKRFTQTRFGRTSPLIIGDSQPNLDFAKGLLYGSMLGGREGSIEFVSSVRGGLTFLWSFACSPIDVSKELIEALRALGEFLASGKAHAFVRDALPEFFECQQYWDTWSEYTKGKKLGFIIGKYSILAFAYVTTPRGCAYLYSNLKRANIMAILGRYSATKNVGILEASARHAQKSRTVLKKASSGSIVAHNPNVLPHIFTKKHCWDKFIELTGDHKKDFKKLVIFLEEQQILYCERELVGSFNSVKSYTYTKQVGRDKIVAIFDINDEKMPLLKNAWVEIGKH